MSTSSSSPPFSWVHRCRVVDIKPSIIETLSLNAAETVVLVGRANGDVEIWNVQQHFHFERTIHNTILGLRRVAFVDEERFVVVGLNGMVKFLNLNGNVEGEFASGGGPVWDVAVCLQLETVALACEDGSVRIFGTETPYVLMGICSGTAKKRLLTCCWNFIKSKHAVNNITLWGTSEGKILGWEAPHLNDGSGSVNHSRSTTIAPTCRIELPSKAFVWCLHVTSTGELISGDSLGNIIIWDQNTRTPIQHLCHHKADILSLCLHPTESIMAATGVDNCIVFLGKKENRWAFLKEHYEHTHDIRAMISTKREHVYKTHNGVQKQGFLLISGGVDTCLLKSEFDPMSVPTKHLPFMHRSPCMLCVLEGLSQDPVRLMLVQQRSWVEVWRLASLPLDAPLPGSKAASSHEMELEQNASLILKLEPAVGGKIQPMFLECSSISANGKYIALSDSKETKIYALTFTGSNYNRVQVEPIHHHRPLPPAYSLTFSSETLIVATRKAYVHLYSITPSLTLLTKFPHHRFPEGFGGAEEEMDMESEHEDSEDLSPLSYSKLPQIKFMTVSKNGRWLATGSFSQIHVFNLDTKEHHVTLPHFNSHHTTMAFHPSGDMLVVAFANNAFLIYNVKDKQIAEWSVALRVPNKLLRKTDKIIGIGFDHGQTFSMVLYAHTYLFHINFSTSRWSLEDKFQPILFCDYLSETEFIVVERPWMSVLQDLPPPMYRPRFGT